MQKSTKKALGLFVKCSLSLILIEIIMVTQNLSVAFHAGNRGSNPLGDAIIKSRGYGSSVVASFAWWGGVLGWFSLESSS